MNNYFYPTAISTFDYATTFNYTLSGGAVVTIFLNKS